MTSMHDLVAATAPINQVLEATLHSDPILQSPSSLPTATTNVQSTETETTPRATGSGAQSAYALVKQFRSSVVSFVTALVVPDFHQRLIRSSDAVPLATKLRAAWRKINDTEFWMACKTLNIRCGIHLPTNIDWMQFARDCRARGIKFKPVENLDALLGPADAVPARRRKFPLKTDGEFPNQEEEEAAAAATEDKRTPRKDGLLDSGLSAMLGTPQGLAVSSHDTSVTLPQATASSHPETLAPAAVTPAPTTPPTSAPLSAASGAWSEDLDRRPPNERHYNSVQAFVAALVAPNFGHRLTLAQATRLRSAWRDLNRQQFNVACMLFLGRPFARKIPTDVDWERFAAKCRERGIVFKPVNVGAVLAGVSPPKEGAEANETGMDADFIGELAASSAEALRGKKRKSVTPAATFALQTAQQTPPEDENGLPSLPFVWQQLHDVSLAVQRALSSCEAVLRLHNQLGAKRVHLDGTSPAAGGGGEDSDGMGEDSGDELQPTTLQL